MLTRDCPEEGDLEPYGFATEDTSAAYAYSEAFVKTLDSAIRANFGTDLWHDILASQNVPKHATAWSTHVGWGDALNTGGYFTGAPSFLTSIVRSNQDEPPARHSAHSTADSSIEGEPCIHHVDLEGLSPSPESSEPDAESAELDVSNTPEDFDDKDSATHNIMPLDAMLKVMRLAQTIQRAARRFKSLLLQSNRPHPLYIHLLHGDNLRAADWNGSSDPYVIVSVLESTKPPHLDNIAAVQTTKSDIAYKTLQPQWDQRLLLYDTLPVVTS
ncbi:hypothetical protein DYB28_007060 [Aphanomyces astaci]|uniref:C2 domain-containing protein n=1 Tax=Aphanomyces astaci TaxID=112090 RepID=A0A9X8DSW2_APHAT|nr:hypothetical protein DYB28_007060 [Aphanomyces astaci]